MDGMGHYDLAVVGGGIAGLYCCLHAPENVPICGEAFSDFQGFMDGALHSAQRALAQALG